MRVAVALCAAALLLVLAAVGPAAAAKCGERCQARRSEMERLRSESSSGVIDFTHDMYTNLLRKAPRDFEVVLVLNALDSRRRCGHCAAAAKEFQVTANSFYRALEGESNIFFASADFDGPGNNEIFRKLQCQSAPVFFHVPASGKPERHNGQLQTAEDMAGYIAGLTGNRFSIYRPPNYGAMAATVLVVVLTVGSIYAAWEHIKDFVMNGRLWAIFSMAFAALMMSGHMWLQIRGAPFSAPDQNGGVSFVAGTNSFQYGAESYIVMFYILVASTGLIVLNEVAIPTSSMAKHRSATYIGVAMAALAFGMLYAVFRTKYGGYPFRFIF